MRFDYFYRDHSDDYTFYRIPKLLFTEEIFEDLSTEAKVLYGLLLDRIGLSRDNGWIDEAGRVYVYFTIVAVKKALRCGNSKACRLLQELDMFGLIERIRRGQGRPAIIFVKNFSSYPGWEVKDSGIGNYRVPETGILRFPKAESNNTEKNDTEKSDINPILSGRIVDNSGKKRPDKDEDKDGRSAYHDFFCGQLSIETLYEMYPASAEIIDAILDLILDTVCSKRKTMRIAGDDKPVEVVKSQFMKLNQLHICYVLDCMKENGSKVRNIKQYLLSALYNAPLTMQSYYQAKVNNDIINKKYE